MAFAARVAAPTATACLLAGGLALSSPAPATAQMTTGTYVGNGTAGRQITGLGFKPDLVLIKGNDFDDVTFNLTLTSAVMRTSTMPAGLSKPMVLDNALIANQIQSLDADGFTIGNDRRVNGLNVCRPVASCSYYWVAFKADADMKVGTYNGNGTSQSIATVGFRPDWLIVMSSAARRAIHASSVVPTASPSFRSYEFDSAAWIAGQFTSLDASGFSVTHTGGTPYANESGVAYHYVAWRAAPSKTFVGSYPGNAMVTNHTGVGFQPDWLVIKPIYDNNALPHLTPPPGHRMASMGAGEIVVNFSNGNFAPDHIEAFLADGFQIGPAGSTNRTYVDCNVDGPGCEYFYVAFNQTSTNYRSIGTAAAYGNGSGTISVTNGSATVTGAGGAAFLTANRGRGDVITIPCDDPPACLNGVNPDGVHYTVQGTASETSLRLTQGYTGTTASGLTYLIRRQFSTLAAWESCIDGQGVPPPGGQCVYFAAPTASLVADDRREVGIAYEDSVFLLTTVFTINGSTTDATHTIALTADGTNRHNGVQGAGVVVDANGSNNRVDVFDANVTVEWLELRGLRGAPNGGALNANSGSTNVLLQNLLIHDFFDDSLATIDQSGIRLSGGGGKSVTVRNAMIWDGDNAGIHADAVGDSLTIENCSIDDMRDSTGLPRRGVFTDTTPNVIVRNTIATRSGTDFATASGSFAAGPTSTNNVSSDATAPGSNLLTAALATDLFVNAGVDLHLKSGAGAIDTGASLAPSFYTDVDGGVRPAGLGWDRGADEFGVTTEVRLQSFAAVAGDASVALVWRTASELDNLGFHLYRGLAERGPWTRLTTSLIPGLGSSATGQAYSYRDGGLVNGTRYYYRLEDVDAASKATSHGPISAVPAVGLSGGAPVSEPSANGRRGKRKGTTSRSCPDWVVTAYGAMAGASASTATLSCTRHGDPEAVSLNVVSRDARSATLELRTGGFYALRDASSQVRVFVPGFDFEQDSQALALPVRRALVDAVVGRHVQLGGVQALDQVGFRGLVPAALGKAEMQVSLDGTVRAGRRALRELALPHVSSDLVRLLPPVFQGETKSAVVLVAPLRYDSRRQQIVLAKRVLVKLLFTGRETGESGRGHFGRKERPQKPVSGELLARLYTTSRGLYAASFEQVFPGQRRDFAASELRLERQGQAVGFHLEPDLDSFSPGSVLYFHADAAASSTDFSSETAFELVRARDGARMPLVSAAPSGALGTNGSIGQASFESDRFYQPGLLDAPDPWLWEGLASGTTRSKSFSLTGVDAASSQASEIEVFLQGASESGNPVDHHVSVSLNGMPVADAQFAGKKPYQMSLNVPSSMLHDGANQLSLTNVADTGVSSLVFLDRFTISYPQRSSLATGVFEGSWAESGTALILANSGPVALLDVTTANASWLRGHEATGVALRFRAEAGHRNLAVSQQALLLPRVAAPTPSTLRLTENQADYLLIAPRAFLTAAEPLVRRRHDQGLQARAVAFEEISDEFGHGQPSAEAIKSFLTYAFHSWARPSPRYVLLLGDATYDPRNFTGISQPSPLPALWTKTSYLWTVSDPQLAAVNGEDALPDLAIGRLPATTVSEANRLVEKLIAWEDSGQGLAGAAALVADNPDIGGDFDANVTDIAASYLAARSPKLLRLSELGPATRPRILDALNAGLSFLSYVGHGGAAVWASENVWNSWDAPSLQAQSQQPLLLTMNCLNGYFVAPSFDSLAESLTKADGRGAIAAFSPSGLSLDGPAHAYHRALMAELSSGSHARLGDALTAAQEAYTQSGLMPELVSIYHLLGDPATRIR